MLAQVRRALDRASGAPGPSEDQRAGASSSGCASSCSPAAAPTTAPAALLEYNRQEALLQQLRAARERAARGAGVAVLRPPAPAREASASGTSVSARRRFIAGGVSIVDWRNAPISRLFYRYEQGDEYEEEIAGRRAPRHGGGAAHGDHPRRPRCSASTRRRASSAPTRRPTAAGTQAAARAAAPGRAAKARRCASTRPTARRRAPAGRRRRTGGRSAPTSTCPTSPG